MPAKTNRIVLIKFLGLGLLLFLDLFLKWFFESRGQVVLNNGGVFGLLPGRWWIGGLVVIFGIVCYEWWKENLGNSVKGIGSSRMFWGYGLVVVGGLGNIIDRIFYGSVRDFIYYPVVNIYGNLADIMVVLGVGILLFRYGGKYQHHLDSEKVVGKVS